MGWVEEEGVRASVNKSTWAGRLEQDGSVSDEAGMAINVARRASIHHIQRSFHSTPVEN